MTPETVAQYAASRVTEHIITFDSSTTPGTDVIVFGLSLAHISWPVGWVADYDHDEHGHAVILRLPGSSNNGVSSVILTLAEPETLVAVAVEAQVGGAPDYGNFSTSSGKTTSGGSQFGTGLHTFPEDGTAFAIWWQSYLPGARLGDAISRSSDQGFDLLGQIAYSPGMYAGQFIAVASKSDAAMDNAGVVLTLNPPLASSGAIMDGARPGMVMYPAPRTVVVDVVVEEVIVPEERAPDTEPPLVIGFTPVPGATSIDPIAVVTVRFSEPVVDVNISMNIAGTPVPGGMAGGGDTRTFTPSLPLALATTYTVVVTGAEDEAGNIQGASTSWSFTTTTVGGISWGTTLLEEVRLAGSPESEWSISGAGDTTVQGFARKFSVNNGASIEFAIDGVNCSSVDIYRIGGYDTGWRKVGTVVNTPRLQGDPAVIPSSNGANTCSAWIDTASWLVPAQAWSGLYVAVPRAPGGASYIPFVVRNDTRDTDVVLKTSETTWYAHNYYGSPSTPFGGKSLNGVGGWFESSVRAHAVSFDRPLVTREHNEESYWLNSEAPLIRFLEKQGIDYKMVASVDLDSSGGLSTVGASRVLMSSGQDAYWSQGMRDNFEAFRDIGGNIIFMSASTALWRVRFSPDRRTMWCFKDTFNSGVPLDTISWTGTWKDTRWEHHQPENLLTGMDFRMSGPQDRTALVNAAVYRNSPFWRGTPVASGTNLSLPEVIGFVADTPMTTQAHAIQVAGSVLNIDGAYVDDNGQFSSGDGNLDWGIVLQRYSSGAIVVGFGTCQWQWALDDAHDGGTSPSNVSAKQATLNLFTDMGVPVRAPQSGLTVTAPATWSDYGLAAQEAPLAPGTYEIMISDGAQWYRVDSGGSGGGGVEAVAIPFPTPLTQWVIDLGYTTNITVVGTNGEVVDPGSIDYEGTTVTLGFSVPFSGTAYCFA